ncbi:nucleotidyltransferase domain-containing protein [Candidatus Latescibacterota bacterium]
MLKLQFRTEDALVDAVLTGLVGVFEAAFPRRIKAYYLFGSYAYGSPVPTSDVDVNIVFRDDNALTELVSERLGFGMRLSEEEEERFLLLTEHLRLISPVQLGLGARQEGFIRDRFSLVEEEVNPRRFLYGEDLIAELREYSPEPSSDRTPGPQRVRRPKLLARAHELICSTHSVPEGFVGQLPFPDEQGEFFGYDAPQSERSGKATRGMERFFNACVFPVCTARLELAGVSVSRKDMVATAYREHVGDEWSDFVEEAFLLCRETWHYRLPRERSDRDKLRQLCISAKAFCSHFLAVYRGSSGARQ